MYTNPFLTPAVIHKCDIAFSLFIYIIVHCAVHYVGCRWVVVVVVVFVVGGGELRRQPWFVVGKLRLLPRVLVRSGLWQIDDYQDG